MRKRNRVSASLASPVSSYELEDVVSEPRDFRRAESGDSLQLRDAPGLRFVDRENHFALEDHVGFPLERFGLAAAVVVESARD